MHKGTEDLLQFLDSTLPRSVFNNELWKCFFNESGEASKKRMNRLFGDKHIDDIRNCKPSEVVALAQLLNMDPWHLIETYGMGEFGINLHQANKILQLQGLTLASVPHVA